MNYLRNSFLFVAGCICILPCFGRSFCYDYEGQTLTYSVVSESNKQCEVIRSHEVHPIGCKVVIPAIASDGTEEYSVTAIGNYAFAGNNNLTEIEIPGTVTHVGVEAFAECKELTSVVLPNSVTCIEKDAFAFCKKLSSIEIPASLTFLGEFAFSSCTSIPEVTLPNTLTTIGGRAFNWCTSLKSVTLPASVKEIGFWPFGYCLQLVEINVDLENDNYTSIDGVLFDKNGTTLIQYPTGKTGEYYIPESVTKIETAAFQGCKIPEIRIPNSVKNIADAAFFGCYTTSITIPESVETIGDMAFYDCEDLKAVYYSAENPREFASNIFDETHYWYVPLYVPEGILEQCRAMDPWKYFNTIKAYNFNGVEEAINDINISAPCEVYTLGGIKVADNIDSLVPGLYLARQGSNVKKIIVK